MLLTPRLRRLQERAAAFVPFLPLPLALRADARTVKVARAPQPSPLRRLARRVRRRLAVVLGRRTEPKTRAGKA